MSRDFLVQMAYFCPTVFLKGRALGTRSIEKMKFQVLTLHLNELGDRSFVRFFHRGSLIVTIDQRSRLRQTQVD